jgi:hypothetical protein
MRMKIKGKKREQKKLVSKKFNLFDNSEYFILFTSFISEYLINLRDLFKKK